MFNFNMNNNNKKNNLVSDSLNEFYKKAKEDIKRANILFPSMKDKKDSLEDEIEQWEKSKQDKTTDISGAIKIPNDKEETKEERITRLANSLYPTMNAKPERELSALAMSHDDNGAVDRRRRIIEAVNGNASVSEPAEIPTGAKDKEEKPKEEKKKNNSSELGSLISDDDLHKLIFNKEKDNKI